jgi:hypothetical protein
MDSARIYVAATSKQSQHAKRRRGALPRGPALIGRETSSVQLTHCYLDGASAGFKVSGCESTLATLNPLMISQSATATSNSLPGIAKSSPTFAQ